VSNLALLTDSSPIRKQNFLLCYSRAREKALSVEIIKNGWKVSRLWPKSIAKPLLSPLLLENSNQEVNAPQASQSIASLLANDSLLILLSTPRKSTEIKAQVARYQDLGTKDSFTQILLFRKIVKGFKEQESTLAAQSYKIQSLEVQLEKARPRKRIKVRMSPNSKFADISSIQKTQIKASETEIEQEEEDSSNNSDSTLDCILVE
jgi:4-hydroxybenzoate polyprenyltransferase